MHQFHIPQCSIQNRNVHSGICEIGQNTILKFKTNFFITSGTYIKYWRNISKVVYERTFEICSDFCFKYDIDN